MMKKALCTLALLGAAATSQAGVLVSQNFDDVATIGATGWVLNNNSSPIGITGSWYQGDQSLFGAQQGAANSYIAANYNSGVAGGTINNWLITPEFTTATGAVVTLWLRGANDAGFFDTLSFGVSKGGSKIADFAVNPSFVVNTDGWAKYTFNIASQGAGATARFAINYTGLSDTANYIGVDSVQVAAVPEPASMLLLGAGLAGLIAARRRQRSA